MIEIFQNKRKRNSAIIAVVFHLILLIVFIFYGLTMPDPIPEEIGLSVQLDIGNTDFGSGDEQPETTAEPEEITEEVIEEVVEETSVPEIFETQDAASDMTVPEPKEVKEEPKEDPKPELNDNLKKVLNQRNLFQSDKNNESEGQGNTNQSGDFGKEDGFMGGSALNGGSDGGMKGNLAGRAFKGAPRINSNEQESGKIVINIIVDRDGNVIRASAGGRGTTITNNALTQKCIESARKAKFSPSPNGQAEQPGTLEYIFVLE